jgi:radical SAM superfamily enzyme YgiQ (UPF0313 family)
MKICLVTARTYDGERGADSGGPLDEDAPLGVLSLAAAVRERGHEVQVCDLNHFVRQIAGAGDLAAIAADWIAASSADVYGFSTISSSYPFTVRIAAALRRLARSRPVVFGGPQATVTDVPLLHAFPCVDVVVRGEAERAFPALLDALGGGAPLGILPGITYRHDGRPRRNTDAPVILDLDNLADPAHDLDVAARRRRFGSVEIGRGCPFACEFCSTNDFFRRKFRLKSPQRVIREMRAVRDAYGHVHFSLVHDMFTVDRRKVLAFCEAMQASGDGMRWDCSARTDCLDEELLDVMAAAGCNSLFFGIESGSPELQRRMGKHLDLGEARHMIASASRRGITTTVSTIVGFPGETREDLGQTAAFVVDAARHPHASVQMHLLAPLPGTPITRRHQEQLQLDPGIYGSSEDRTGSVAERDEELPLIAAHPDLFSSFYVFPTPLPLDYIEECRSFIRHGLRRCPWLIVALQQDTGDILGVFDEWRSCRAAAMAHSWSYRERSFVQELLTFVGLRYRERGYCATDVMRQYYTELLEVPAQDASVASAGPEADCNDLSAIPMLIAGARLLTLSGSAIAVIERLRAHETPTGDEATRERTMVVRRTNADEYHLTELPEIPAAVLTWCDGRRRMSEVVEQFSSSGIRFGDAPLPVVCRLTLQHLYETGCLRFVSADRPS